MASNKNIYTALIVLVLIGAAIAAYVSLNYKAGDEGVEITSLLWGVVWATGFNAAVLVFLLVTLGRAKAVVQEAETLKMQGLQKGHEKDHVIIIEGIGDTFAIRLNQLGIITVPQLLDADAADVGPKIGSNEATVKEWQSMGWLMQVKGIGAQYAEILVMAGVTSIGQLATSDPGDLTAKIDAIEESREVAVLGVNVTENHVKRWITAAKEYISANGDSGMVKMKA